MCVGGGVRGDGWRGERESDREREGATELARKETGGRGTSSSVA